METSEDRTNIIWRFRGIPFRHGLVDGQVEDGCPDEEAEEEHTTPNKSIHELGSAGRTNEDDRDRAA